VIELNISTCVGIVSDTWHTFNQSCRCHKGSNSTKNL